MHFDHCRAVFQRIFLRHGFTGQLALFADQCKGLMQVICDGCTENKASGLCAYDYVKLQILYQILHGIDCKVHAVSILQHARNISENNSLLREIRYTSYIFFQFFHFPMPLFLLFSIKWNPVKRDLSMLSLYYFPSLKSIQPKARIFPAMTASEKSGLFYSLF